MELEPFLLLVQIHISIAVDLKINGDLSYALELSDVDLNQLDQSASELMVMRVTAGPTVECIYQYPEKEQINAILSNMMNRLTKVFVEAQGLIGDEDGRRRPETRFRVVDRKKTRFFDDIYSNMTDEYSKLYNNTAYRVDRSTREPYPCQHQDLIKQTWRELLDHSLATFQKAALRCLHHLRTQSGDDRARSRLGQFIMREVAKIRSDQLDMLCERFQLCYNELLR